MMGQTAADPAEDPRRARIREAAWRLLLEHGYSGLRTSEIAQRAGVSKRDLYSLFGSKLAIVTACVATAAGRMRRPLATPRHLDRDRLSAILRDFGTAVLVTVTRPPVLALYRVALIEAEGSPELARLVEDGGRNANRAALAGLLRQAQRHGLVDGASPETMAASFLSLLWDDLLLRLLLGTAQPPSIEESKRRADAAVEAFWRVHGPRTSRPAASVET